MKAMRDFEILGVAFDAICEEEAAGALYEKISGRSGDSPPALLVTPNSAIVMIVKKGDARLGKCLAAADISLPDGSGIAAAARRAGVKLHSRATGIGTAERLLEKLAASGGSVFIFGGKPGVAERAAEALIAKHPGLTVAGTEHGYHREEEYPELAERIAAAHPDFAAVCLGSPRQEYFLCEYLARTRGAGAAAALGGSADVWAGKVRRCPSALSRAGLEWLYRMIRQPSRIRILPDLVRFRILTGKRRFFSEKT